MAKILPCINCWISKKFGLCFVALSGSRGAKKCCFVLSADKVFCKRFFKNSLKKFNLFLRIGTYPCGVNKFKNSNLQKPRYVISKTSEITSRHAFKS